MSTNTQQVNPALNTVLWVITIAIVAAGVYGNNFYSSESLLYRVLALVVLSIVAGLIALQTTQGRAFWELAKGARTEIRKVVWPTRQETVQTTMLVMLVVIIAGLILWALDSILGWLVSLVIG